MENNLHPKFCRICNSPSEVSLFDANDGLTLAEMMSQLADTPVGELNITKLPDTICLFFFQITENDGKPSQICNECAEKLRAAVAFRKQIQDTEKLLETLCG